MFVDGYRREVPGVSDWTICAEDHRCPACKWPCRVATGQPEPQPTPPEPHGSVSGISNPAENN